MEKQRPITSLGKAHQIILDLLYDNLGTVIPNERFREAVQQDNWSRRLRELREEEGWQIPAVKPQGYVMHTTERIKEKSDRRVSLRLRTEVLTRDNFTCQMCGHSAGQQYRDGKRVRLEADHIIPFNDGGPTELDNLQTLCSRCNAGKKAAIAYGQADDRISLVVRLAPATFEALERQAKQKSMPVKDFIQQKLLDMSAIETTKE